MLFTDFQVVTTADETTLTAEQSGSCFYTTETEGFADIVLPPSPTNGVYFGFCPKGCAIRINGGVIEHNGHIEEQGIVNGNLAGDSLILMFVKETWRAISLVGDWAA